MSALLAPDPLLDPARLATLRELALLDRAPLRGLDAISRIASRTLGVPISALSLISWDRQVTVGQSGLGIEDEEDEPVVAPLSHSFCKHVVRTDAMVSIEDSRIDTRVRHNGATKDGIRAYLGVPIRLDGQCVGALCAVDAAPHMWTEDDRTVLADLAAVAVDVLELQRVQREGGMHDALTGLPRRPLFVERVAELLGAREYETDEVTVVAADLRAFRLFNEAWGHDAGDAILTEVAGRFTEAIGGSDRVCRIAGDEFLVVQSGGEHPDALIARLRQMLSAPSMKIEGVDQPLSALFASATSAPGVSARELVDDALATLSATKLTEGTSHDGPVTGPAMDRLRLRNAIVGAERRGELRLHYQPLFDLSTGKVSSVEALLRWDHPELGSVSPADFIPVAESTGAIISIGDWVLRTACRDVAAWRAGNADGLSVAVNVAPEQVRMPSFDASVGEALDAAGLPASALSLEITERTLLKDRASERHTIEALQERGVDLHLDDFGTGYSSLGYLTQFPLDVIKIDRIFVSRLGEDRAATALVEGIINVAHSLELQTVAEGIETLEQRDLLAGMGCDHGQGFFLARPGPGDQITELLRSEEDAVAER